MSDYSEAITSKVSLKTLLKAKAELTEKTVHYF
jgi:hypothetical protein